MQKLIGVVRAPRAITPVPPDLPGLCGCVLHEPLSAAEVAGVWMLWFEDEAPLEVVGIDDAYLVDERRQWEYERTWPLGELTPGVKRLSFVRTHANTTRAEFAVHWRDIHAPLARVHHPALWRYVQNVVIRPVTPGSADGVAELSFRTEADLRERMYDSAAGREVIAKDVASFIDVAAGWRIDTRERVLVPPPNSNAF